VHCPCLESSRKLRQGLRWRDSLLIGTIKRSAVDLYVRWCNDMARRLAQRLLRRLVCHIQKVGSKNERSKFYTRFLLQRTIFIYLSELAFWFRVICSKWQRMVHEPGTIEIRHRETSYSNAVVSYQYQGAAASVQGAVASLVSPISNHDHCSYNQKQANYLPLEARFKEALEAPR
jgi:hypothetical protein